MLMTYKFDSKSIENTRCRFTEVLNRVNMFHHFESCHKPMQVHLLNHLNPRKNQNLIEFLFIITHFHTRIITKPNFLRSISAFNNR